MTTALALPATALGDVDVTIGDAPTSGMAVTTVEDVTTFAPTGTASGTLSTGDLQSALGTGREVDVVTGDGDGAVGTLRLTAPVTSGSGVLALVASGPIIAAGAIAVGSVGVFTDGAITLDGANHIGDLTLETTSPEETKVLNVGSLDVKASSVGGPLTVRTSDDLGLAGRIVSRGPATFVAGEDLPPETPLVGTGDVHVTPGTSIDAGGAPVMLYSARRQTARLAGLTINGTAYTPGPYMVTTDTEAWGGRWGYGERYASSAPFRFVFQEADRTMPIVRLRFPSGATFSYGQVVHIVFSCTDLGGSGLASCTSNQRADGTLDTSTPGAHDAVVTAKDGAGNIATATAHFFVRQPPKPCIAPTSVTLRIERPKHVKSVVATLGGKRQKVSLTKTRIVLKVDVKGRPHGTYPLKVTMRRAKHDKTVVRHPKVTVYKCQRR
jgi:hypothetical protein